MPATNALRHRSNLALPIAGALTLWLALVFVLAGIGAFVRPPGTVPIPIIIGVTAPIVVFLAAFRLSRIFRDYVLTADLRFTNLGFRSCFLISITVRI